MQSALLITFLCLSYSLSVGSLLDDSDPSKIEMTSYHIWKATQQLPETEGDLLPKKKKDECIKELAEYSKTNPEVALETFKGILVDSVSDLNPGGQLDIGDTWERYIVAAVPEAFGKKSLSKAGHPSFSTLKNLDSLQDNPEMRLHGLVEMLKEWYTSCGVKSESKDKCSSSQKSKVEEMENLGLTAEDLTPHVWDLAIHFFYLQLMWARKKLAQDTVTQMAIFQHFRKDPKGSTKSTVNPEIFHSYEERIKELYKWINSSFPLNGPLDLDKVLQNIIPFTHEFSHGPVSVVSDFLDDCRQEYFAVTTLIEFCREEASRMYLNDDIFWTNLKRIASVKNIEPFACAYQKLSIYFRNGTPLDQNFEYYTLISDITKELKKFRENESDKILWDHIKSIVPSLPDDKNKRWNLKDQKSEIFPTKEEAKTLDQAEKTESLEIKEKNKKKYSKEKTNPLKPRARTSKDIKSRVLTDRVNLLLNYAAEIHQFIQLGNFSSFNPSFRATKDQMSNIAFWLCKIFSPWGGSKNEEALRLDQNVEKLKAEIFSTNLPMIVKMKVHDISLLLCYLSKRYMVGKYDCGFEEKHWMLLDEELSSSFKNNGSYRRGIKHFELEENQKMWDAVWNLAESDLSNISKKNAKVLEEQLHNSYRNFHGQAILDKMYETYMKSFTEESTSIKSFRQDSESVQTLNKTSKGMKISKKGLKAKKSKKSFKLRSANKGSEAMEEAEENMNCEEKWEVFLKNLHGLTSMNRENKKYLEDIEFKSLNNMYHQIQKFPKVSPLGKTQWMEKVSPFILNMSIDLQKTLFDLFEVDQRSIKSSGKPNGIVISSSKENSIDQFELEVERLSEKVKTLKARISKLNLSHLRIDE
ncbi:hypothetical protein PCASD_03640 [Puccinia coronata f. sp. avenae]|uniref:Uncharacterized protein n=2 Tax=Puccinia coronata f. sp. avenae TaxID=200324 RepID=A0A2N5V9M5_9BASI|nr:hypothetical protein PCASD_03640 [Puccinia coronata f. sp. avenae]